MGSESTPQILIKGIDGFNRSDSLENKLNGLAGNVRDTATYVGRNTQPLPPADDIHNRLMLGYITAVYDASVGYAWQELRYDSLGTLFLAYPDTTNYHLFDLNGRTDIPAKTLVYLLRIDGGTGEPRYIVLSYFDVKGIRQYQVKQMVSDNQDGWDWARFHPT